MNSEILFIYFGRLNFSGSDENRSFYRNKNLICHGVVNTNQWNIMFKDMIQIFTNVVEQFSYVQKIENRRLFFKPALRPSPLIYYYVV